MWIYIGGLNIYKYKYISQKVAICCLWTVLVKIFLCDTKQAVPEGWIRNRSAGPDRHRPTIIIYVKSSPFLGKPQKKSFLLIEPIIPWIYQKLILFIKKKKKTIYLKTFKC